MDEQSEEIVLSKRNQKRFNKLTNKFNQRIKELQDTNLDLSSQVNNLQTQLDLTKTPEVLEKKTLLSDYDRAYEEYLNAQIESKQIFFIRLLS